MKKIHATLIPIFSLFILCGMLLIGCAAPILKHDIQKVDIPITVTCIVDEPVKPKLHTDTEIKAMSDYSAIIALLLDRVYQFKYESELEASLAGCR